MGKSHHCRGVTSRTTHHTNTISTAPHFHGTSTGESLRLVKVCQCVVLWLRVVQVGLDVQSVDVAATRTPSVSNVWVENSRQREAGAKSGMAASGMTGKSSETQVSEKKLSRPGQLHPNTDGEKTS